MKSTLNLGVIALLFLLVPGTARIGLGSTDDTGGFITANTGELMADARLTAESPAVQNGQAFAKFAMNWMNEPCGDPDWCEDCDLDRNGRVDFEDFDRFCWGWLRGPGYLCTRWLIGQQNPATGLLDSYADDGDFNAWIYDQALAIIAFTEAGELHRARMILDTMKELQRVNPKRVWYECYNSNDPQVVCSYTYITGPIAFMVIAINYYEHHSHDKTYAPMARDALAWLNTLRFFNPGDERYGSIGYSSQFPNIISTEHNADAYSAFLWRGRLDGNQSYIETAQMILDYLRREMWARSPLSDGPYHNVNVFWRGYKDYAFCTDPQTWTILAVGPLGPDGEEFYKALDWLWWNPYGSTRVNNLQDYNDNIRNIDGVKSCTGESSDYIWVEGTEGAAAAYYYVGENDKGDYFHKQMWRTLSPDGGLVHSFCEREPNRIRWPENYRFNHVASVAWHYFNEAGINPLSPLPPDGGCFPLTFSTYSDWLGLGAPDCWCAKPIGSGYQCDGDADGKDSGGVTKYRCFTGDLALIVNNWKKPPTDPTFNACADIDHKAQVFGKYRVFTNDLHILVANWKKKDADLLGNCPRPE